MNYKAIVTEYFHKAKHMATAVEDSCNQMAKQGYELVTISITASEKAILVFKTDNNEEDTSEECLNIEEEASSL